MKDTDKIFKNADIPDADIICIHGIIGVPLL